MQNDQVTYVVVTFVPQYEESHPEEATKGGMVAKIKHFILEMDKGPSHELPYFLVTPHYSGAPPFSDDINLAWRYTSSKLAASAVRALANQGDFQVRPTSQFEY